MDFLKNHDTVKKSAHRLDKAVEQGRGKRERFSVRRRLTQRKAAIPALPGPDLRGKTCGFER